jgi:hypothetical protein
VALRPGAAVVARPRGASAGGNPVEPRDRPRARDLFPELELVARPAVRATRRPRWVLALAALALAAAVAVGFAMRSWRDEQSAPSAAIAAPRAIPPEPPGPWTGAAPIQAPAPSVPPPAPSVPPPAPAPTPPTAPKIVELRVESRPIGVAVVLDRKYLGRTPLVVQLAPPDAPIELWLQHPAYHEVVRMLALRADTSLNIVLRPTGAPPAHEGKYKDAECMSCHRPRLAR